MKRIFILFILFNYWVGSAQHNSNNLWTITSNERLAKDNKSRSVNKYLLYELDLQALMNQLKTAPDNRSMLNTSPLTLSFPDENGNFVLFRIAEASVMAKELQRKHPEIKSYIGKSNDNTIIRFSIAPLSGLNGIILHPNTAPTIIKNRGQLYQIFSEKDHPLAHDSFDCEVTGQIDNAFQSANRQSFINGDLRLYRLALVTNGEYSQLVLNDLGVSSTASDAVKKNAILGHLNSVLTDVNSIYERDVSVSMQLIASNEDVIFLDPSTDGLTNFTSVSLLHTNQQICDNIIGNNNYDLAHLLTTSFGGVANLASVCNSSTKAEATSGIAPPGYNPFDLRYKSIVHEMGHQFGATHTFNSCDIGTTSPQTSVETGAGTTIMSYANSCLNHQTIHSYHDLYFHAVSIAQIRNTIQNSGNCATIISTGNTPPNASAGIDYTVPKSTPLKLKGNASDPDGTILTYTWEQVDPQSALSPPVSVATEGPVFRWLPPTTSDERYLPNLNTILAGQTANRWEVLPSVSRNLNFVFLVRDNDARGGETSADQMTITIDENAGPFYITSGDTNETWYAGATKTVTWNVANTNAGNVNTPNVDVLFSTDGGANFSTVIASNVPNNGSYSFTVPFGITTNNGRIMVKGHNNIFLDINNAPITVEEKPFLINISNAEKEKSLCLSNGNSISYSFTYNSYLGFNGNVSFSAGNLSGANITFSPASTATNNTNVVMTISNLSSTHIGHHTINITASSGSQSHTDSVILNVYDNSLNTVSLISPANQASNVLTPYTFEWAALANASAYNIEIASDNGFVNIIETASVTGNTYVANQLNYNTTYYWHVKPINTCGAGNYSSTYSFTTQPNHANDTYVPDDAFEQALINLGYDTGNLDDYVPTANIQNVTSLSLDNLGITDLTGIEDFVSLRELHVRNYQTSQLHRLDLSHNTQLVTVYAYYNQISYVDVSNSPNLLILGLFDNQLSSIDLSHNPRLGYLYLARNNLTQLNLNNNTSLVKLECYNNLLTNIDVTNNTRLTYLSCGDTPFHSNHNAISSIDVSNNPLLEYIDFSNNLLTSIDLSNKPNLERVWAANNQLTSINLEGASSLEIVDCTHNQITDIYLNDSPALFQVQLAYNNLSCLDVSNNPLITHLYCNNNQIKTLDLTNNTVLTRCDFQNNNLILLNIKNTNNASFSNSYSLMDARNNPNLSCIQVDNAAAAIAGTAPYNVWYKDSTANYSENCDYSTIDADNDGVPYINDLCHCTIHVESVDANGCSNEQLNISSTQMGEIKFYPNPTTSMLYIVNSGKSKIDKLEVYNSSGQLLITLKNNVYQIDLSNYTSGIYFIRVSNNNQVVSYGKIIKF